MTNLRPLLPEDESQLEAFLVRNRDSSMFLRCDARRHGLAHLPYVAAFRNGQVVGVVSHSSSGSLLVQAPEHASELAIACAHRSGRQISGLLGPRRQVCEARTALQLDAAEAATDANEWLYSLTLSDLIVPTALLTGTIACRAPLPNERDTLCDWRLAYDIETLGATDSPNQRARAAGFLDAQIADGNAWVATSGDVLVSLSALNAALPDIVQLGGIYTPPEYRGRGFAKSAVAATLLAARSRGATRAVLFTGNPSAARTYEALGFQRTGDYGLILFK